MRPALPLIFAFIILVSLPIKADDTPSFELGFSPGGGALRVVLDSLSAANTEILVACYEFTSRDIAAALEAAAHRGVKVFIVADEKASNDRYSQIPVLLSAGISIRRDPHYSIMHNKFIIIDGSSVETGSFNYTAAAARSNAENALWLRGEEGRALALRYRAEWARLWQESF